MILMRNGNSRRTNAALNREDLLALPAEQSCRRVIGWSQEPHKSLLTCSAGQVPVECTEGLHSTCSMVRQHAEHAAAAIWRDLPLNHDKPAVRGVTA